MTQNSIKRILIFDDDADFRKLLKARLGNQFEGVELEEYDPVARGIPGKDFDWSRYDVMLLDYNLKAYGITGLDILHTNRKNLNFPATIMLTGQGSEEVAVRALKAGVYDYLRKETLDKDELRQAIREAYEKQQTERERLGDLTRHSHAFNKALFYQKLEQHQSHPDDQNRILLLINLDEHQLIEELAGLIMRDNIIRHIAKQSYQVFQERDSNPNITRFSDIAVALLVDDPGSDSGLEARLQELCDTLQQRPYEFEEKIFHYTVSIGVVPLRDHGGDAEAIIRAARRSCSLAEKDEGNSYHIFDESLDKTEKSSPELAERLRSNQPREQDTPAATPDRKREAPAGQEAPADSDTAQPPRTPEPQKPVPAKPAAQAPPRPEPEKPAPAEPAAPAPPQPPAAPPQEDSKTAEKPAPAGKAETGEKPDSKAGAEPEAEAGAEPEEEAAAPAEPVVRVAEFMQAFKENRLTQTFQPIISLVDSDDEDSALAMYYVSLQMLNKDGSVLGAGELFGTTDPELRKSIDRWMLREAIGHVVNSSRDYLFLLPLSRASMADATLFNWLRKLLSGFEEKHPGRFIGLEIDAADFAAVQKQATALVTYLRKNHGFKFMLGNVGPDDDVARLCNQGQFNLVRLDHNRLQELAHDQAEQEEGNAETVISAVRNKGVQIIADNIEDAMALTATIGTGADYAMGAFVGEPADHLEDQPNVESMEII